MIERDPKTLARLQFAVTALIEHRVSTSLADVERALARWRGGTHSALAAHGAVLRHAARCERTVERVTAAAGDRPEGILRDAVEAGLMSAEEFIELVGKPYSEVASIGALRDDDETSAPDKRRTIEQLLSRGAVLIHVDARRSDVIVPARFCSDPSLVLRFGYTLTPPIRDLTVDDETISGTLTFGGSPFHVVLSWPAVYAAMVEGEQRGTVWPEDVPDDVLASPNEPAAPSAAAPAIDAGPKTESVRPKRASHLKLVE